MGGGKIAVYMNERSLVISLNLFDLVELSHGLLLQSERRSALSWCACGLIFIHVLEREMGIANTGNHLAYSEMYFWESRFHIHQGNNFLQIQGFQGSGRVASRCEVVGFLQPLGV